MIELSPGIFITEPATTKAAIIDNATNRVIAVTPWGPDSTSLENINGCTILILPNEEFRIGPGFILNTAMTNPESGEFHFNEPESS